MPRYLPSHRGAVSGSFLFSGTAAAVAAGPGYKTPLGHMRTGVPYRAAALAPNDADLETLESMKLTAVHDVRTGEEVAQRAYHLPADADYLRTGLHLSPTTLAKLRIRLFG